MFYKQTCVTISSLVYKIMCADYIFLFERIYVEETSSRPVVNQGTALSGLISGSQWKSELVRKFPKSSKIFSV